MDGERLYADVLQAFGKFDYDLRGFVPAETGLDGNGPAHCLHDRLGDGHHLVGIAHHPGACPAPRDLGDGTAEVDVDHIRPVPAYQFDGMVCHLRGLDHRFKDMTVDLDAHGGFFFEGLHLGKGLRGIPDEAVGGDEFGVDHISPLLPAEDAERNVRHVLHRSQQHRSFAQIQIPYFHKVQI